MRESVGQGWESVYLLLMLEDQGAGLGIVDVALSKQERPKLDNPRRMWVTLMKAHGKTQDEAKNLLIFHEHPVIRKLSREAYSKAGSRIELV